MSGPKESEWEIERQRRREIAQQVRMDKENQLAYEIEQCRKSVRQFCSNYKSESDAIADKIDRWLDRAEQNISGNLRLGWQELNGARGYLAHKEVQLQKHQQRRQERQEKWRQEKQRQAELEALREPTEAERLLEGLRLLLKENPAVVNSGIQQRVSLIEESLKVNPENAGTLKQVAALFEKTQELVENMEVRKKETDYAKQAFAEIIGSTPPSAQGSLSSTAYGGAGKAGQTQKSVCCDSSGNGPGSLSGSIDGMPISVTFDEKSNNIVLITPEKGDCKGHLTKLSARLAEKGLSLGTIKIRRTGENWNPVKSYQNDDQRVRA